MDFNNMTTEQMAKAYMESELEKMKKADLDKVATEKAAAEKAEIEELGKKVDKIFNLR